MPRLGLILLPSMSAGGYNVRRRDRDCPTTALSKLPTVSPIGREWPIALGPSLPAHRDPDGRNGSSRRRVQSQLTAV